MKSLTVKTHVVFKKKPSAKNLQRRSVSFSSESEFKHVQKTDTVTIEIYHPGGTTHVNMSGSDFRKSISKVTMKSGKDIFVLRF